MNEVIEKALHFKAKYPSTIAWRIRKHAEIVGKHINQDEKIRYVFVGQKNDNPFDFVSTNVVVITDKRIVIGTKRLLFGYFYTSITPDLFNDLKIQSGIVWGKIYIDTINELVAFSNISKKALDEIETEITENIIREKQKYQNTKK